MSQANQSGPGASYPPPPDAAQSLTAAQAQMADVAEHLRGVWVSLQASATSVRYRDAIYDVAAAARHAAQMADAVGRMVSAHLTYAALKRQPGLALDDWHEADPFAQPPDATVILPTTPAAPEQPGEGSAV